MTLKLLRTLFVSSAVCLSMYINTANAFFVDYGDYLTDTRTNLDWMDITPTINMSYNDVLLATRNGGIFEDWRIATAVPSRNISNNNGLWEMLTNWGVGTGTNTYKKYVDADSLLQLIEIMGPTAQYVATSNQPGFGPKTGQTVTQLIGLSTDTNFFGTKQTTNTLWATNDYRRTLNGEVSLWSSSVDRRFGSSNFGTFLVRDSINLNILDDLNSNPDNYEQIGLSKFRYIASVPEPSLLVLLGIGLAGIGFTKRMKE